MRVAGAGVRGWGRFVAGLAVLGEGYGGVHCGVGGVEGVEGAGV